MADQLSARDWLKQGLKTLAQDGFTALKEGTSRQFGVYDADALYAYFQANSPISPAAADRIKRLNEAK